jgi:hypothetical protein
VSVEELERCAECGGAVGVYEAICPVCGARLTETKLKVFRRLRDSGSVTAGAFEVMEQLLAEGVHADSGTTERGLRKQVTDLTLDDLRRCPVWEFAIDEEGEPGQDEETLRPRAELKAVDPAEGLFVVSARFIAADGAVLLGYAIPSDTGEEVEAATILTETGANVGFEYGIREPDHAALETRYTALAKRPPELFPIRVEALVPTTKGRLADKIRGFAYVDSGGRTRLKS